MIDNHVHIDFDDFKNNVLDYKVYAESLGLEFTVTNHAVIPSCIPPGYKIQDKGVFLDDYSFLKCSLISDNIDEYISTLRRYDIFAGVEMDYVKGKENILKDFIDSHPFDLVLGSMHVVDGFNVARKKDMYEYLKIRNPVDIYKSYFNNVSDVICSELFDVVAHFDIVRKFSPLVRFDFYGDQVANLVDLLAEHDMGLEVNTSGVKFTGSSYPSIEVLHMCKNKGIDKITLGSDAHYLRHLGQNLDEGIEKLKRVGYKRVVKFKNRVPEFVDL